MKRASFYTFLAIAVVALTSFVVAQMGAGRGRMMRGPIYNTATEATVLGTVDDVQQITGQATGPAGAGWARCPGGWTGTHVLLKIETGTVVVHVGPSAYLASKNFTIAKGDSLKVLGSKMQYNGADFLIAKEITKGDQVLTLRDANGFPLWAGFRRAAPSQLPSGN